MTISEDRLLLRVAEAAEKLGVRKTAMYRLVAPIGPIPTVTLGPNGHRRIRRVDLEAYVESLGEADGGNSGVENR